MELLYYCKLLTPITVYKVSSGSGRNFLSVPVPAGSYNIGSGAPLLLIRVYFFNIACGVSVIAIETKLLLIS